MCCVVKVVSERERERERERVGQMRDGERGNEIRIRNEWIMKEKDIPETEEKQRIWRAHDLLIVYDVGLMVDRTLEEKGFVAKPRTTVVKDGVERNLNERTSERLKEVEIRCMVQVMYM